MITAADVQSMVIPMLETWRGRYFDLIDKITRAWEQRFRHRQYRPDEPEDGEHSDWETREAPRAELEVALDPFLTDEIGCLVLAVSPQIYEDKQPIAGQASIVMALDVLARAEALGFFAEPCSEAVRFPDLPLRDSEVFHDERCAAVYAARRREIILAYVQRLEAAGHDASWVEIPPAPTGPEGQRRAA